MHSMWKGAISFGLVMIPVRLYAATEQRDIAFRQVHRADGGRIRFRRVCSVCGQDVAYEDVAKGYELASGEMVVLTDEDLADLPLPTAKAIEVLQFVPAGQLDPILFNRSYYVEPEAAGTRAYVLLREALEQSGRVAVAQVALRQRESLAMLRSRDGVLVLETLLWPDEVRAPLFPFLQQETEVRPQELVMAASLIDSMTSDFDPQAHHDRYREALTALVEAKVQGRELLQPTALEIAAGPAASLTDALRASLEAAREPGPAREVGPARHTGKKTDTTGAKRGSRRAGRARAGPAAAGAEPEAARPEEAKPEEAKPGAGRPGTRRSAARRSAQAKPARKAS